MKQKLICHFFAEDNSFTVMIRLSNARYESVYNRVGENARAVIDNRYPCGDGGWIQYRVTDQEQLDEIRTIVSAKF